MCVYSILAQFITFVLSEVQSAFFSIYINACLVMSATIETLVCKQKCTSNVWSYFGFVPNSDNRNRLKDLNEAICKICFKETGSLPKPVRIAVSNTSNLFSHLRVHHTEVYSQLKAAMEKAKQSATASQGGEMQSKQQPKMDSFVKVNMYSRGSSKWEELTHSVTYCIAKDMLPIRIVKKEGFKTLVKSLIHGTSFLLENTCPRKPFQICKHTKSISTIWQAYLL